MDVEMKKVMKESIVNLLKEKKGSSGSKDMPGKSRPSLAGLRINNKRSQITIFIIFALIAVTLIALLIITREPTNLEAISIENPQAFIDSCARDSISEAINTLRVQGGEIEPKGSVMFRGRDITYLCYTSKFYTPCTNQKPSLIEDIQDEIITYAYPRISNCFNSLKTELEKAYDVEMSEGMNVNLKLKSGRIVTNIEKDLKISKGDTINEYNNFKVELSDPLFDLSKIAMEIANQESEFCNFDILGFMIIYPEYDLDKIRTGDSDIIYTIKDRKTKKEFVFAVRTCVLPAGF